MDASRERIDDLHRKGYRIIQNPDTFCFGMDAVLLAGFAEFKPTDRILDIGTGTGILPLLLEGRDKGANFIGIDIQAGSVAMAKRSVHLNGLCEKIEILQCSVADALKTLPKASFDGVVTNPPYMPKGKGLTNPQSAKAIARHEIHSDLDQWLYTAAKLLKVGGKLAMVHRPHRLHEIMQVLAKHELGVKRMKMVHPFIDQPANMVLIEAVRKGKTFMVVEKPLIVYESVDHYTKEIHDVYGY